MESAQTFSVLRSGWAVRCAWTLLLPILMGATSQNGIDENPPSFEYSVDIVVTNRDTGDPVPEADITILNPYTFRTLADKLKTDRNGSLTATVAVRSDEVANASYWVSPAYPNPVFQHHRKVTVRYTGLGDAVAPPMLEFFDILGRPVDAGSYLPAGAYFYRLRLAGGLSTPAQRLTVAASSRFSLDLEPVTERGFLTAGQRLEGVRQLETRALLIVEAEGYSTQESTVTLEWLRLQTVGVSLSPSDLYGRSEGLGRHRAEIRSPDGRTSFQVTIQNSDQIEDCLSYRILRDGVPLIRDSRLGLVIPGEAPFGCGIEISDHASGSESDRWHPAYGQQREVLDRHEKLTLDFVGASDGDRVFNLEVRAYDEGIAFRYVLPKDAETAVRRITGEQTQIRLPINAVAYTQHGVEEPYDETPIHALEDRAQQPLTVDFQDGRYAVIAEADNENYPLMWLSPARPSDGLIKIELQGTVELPSHPFKTPWRVIVIGDRPGDLIEHSTLIQNLAQPIELRNSTWVRPGKALRAGLSTSAGRHAVDFAAAHDFDYILFDAGWYGEEWSRRSIATRPVRDLDVEAVIRYASEHDIGVFLYVNRIAIEHQLDTILPVYRDWGIRGIKPGFVDVGTQDRTRFLRSLVRSAADHRLMVNIHDGYRPDGFSRTYPNLLTQEGVRGNEHFPGARHNTILPFTRFVIGPADYAIGYGNERIGTSFAHQLALAVVFYSPLQFLLWTDSPGEHWDDPALRFWTAVPTVWDETRVLDGRIGEYVVMARRSGDDWFVGVITNEQPRSLDVPLDFLVAGLEYEADIFRDDLTSTAKRIPAVTEHLVVTADQTLRVAMVESGGQGVHFRPTEPGR